MDLSYLFGAIEAIKKKKKVNYASLVSMSVPWSVNKLVDSDVLIGLWPIILCPESGIMVFRRH